VDENMPSGASANDGEKDGEDGDAILGTAVGNSGAEVSPMLGSKLGRNVGARLGWSELNALTPVGQSVGSLLGISVGSIAGNALAGFAEEGAALNTGATLGWSVLIVLASVGQIVGRMLGCGVGSVGSNVGIALGLAEEGAALGSPVGQSVGSTAGARDGARVEIRIDVTEIWHKAESSSCVQPASEGTKVPDESSEASELAIVIGEIAPLVLSGRISSVTDTLDASTLAISN
jgi:hypothetical protein